MHKMIALLTALLIITMVVSCLCYMNGREADSISVSIPVVNTAPLSSTPLEQFRRQRDDTTAADIEACIRRAGKKMLCDVQLFDVYQGKQIEEGKKSMAYSLV